MMGLFDEIKERIKPASIVLDIGSGIRPQQIISCDTHYCVEPYGPYRAELKRKYPHVSTMDCDWERCTRSFKPRSVDTIFLLDVIEHLDKSIATDLLERTIPIARKQVVVFTPLGFVEQSHPDGVDNWGMKGGAWQEHKSGWWPNDFEGWDITIDYTFHGEHGAFFSIKDIK